MIKKDFHGWLVEDALQEVHSIVGNVRYRAAIENAEFITGNGKIKTELLNLLKQLHLNPTVQWGNSGVISVTIE